MADTSIINIRQVVAGTFVRVVLPNYMGSRVSPVRVKEFARQLPGEPPTSMPVQRWGRVMGVDRRSFLAVVLLNDTSGKILTLEIIDKTRSKFGQERYRIEIPYQSFMRLFRLVKDGRTLSATDEVKWRRKHPRARFYKEYIHPFDRFVPVELIT